MSYQTLLNQVCGWVFSDATNAAWVIGTIVVIGAINGIRLSLNHCESPHNGRIL